MDQAANQPFSKRARTRDQLLRAAQDLLMDQSAAALGIRQIAERAGVVHATFYNYYGDIDEVLEDLGRLILLTHAHCVQAVRAQAHEPAALFAATTRQTLRLSHGAPKFARLMFDAGLPPDRFLSAMREPLKADLLAGCRLQAFDAADVDVSVALISGAMLGLAIDLHRGRAREPAIEALTAALLEHLGLSRAKAAKLAVAPLTFCPPPPVPLTWRALGLTPPETAHVA